MREQVVERDFAPPFRAMGQVTAERVGDLELAAPLQQEDGRRRELFAHRPDMELRLRGARDIELIAGRPVALSEDGLTAVGHQHGTAKPADAYARLHVLRRLRREVGPRREARCRPCVIIRPRGNTIDDRYEDRAQVIYDKQRNNTHQSACGYHAMSSGWPDTSPLRILRRAGANVVPTVARTAYFHGPAGTAA